MIAKEQKEKISDLDEVMNVTCYQAKKYCRQCILSEQNHEWRRCIWELIQIIWIPADIRFCGEGFSKSDYGKFQKVALIDETASSNFFEKGEEIGKDHRNQRRTFYRNRCGEKDRGI